MKVNKKTILSLLILILSVVWVPINIISAQGASLNISAGKYNLAVGEKTKITVETTYATAIGKNVSLSVVDNEGALETKTCTFKSDGAVVLCQVIFNSSVVGSFYVEANYLTYTAKTINPIVVGISCSSQNEVLKDGSCKTCVLPEVPNSTKTDCITQNVLSGEEIPTPNSTDTTYKPLASLPGLEEPIDTATDCAFGKYLNIMIKLIIGLAAVMAMVMIVMGGIEYMTSELISGKEAGKETVQHALLGLVLALSAYLILNTINPKLLNACLNNIPEVIITIDGPDAGDDTIDPDFAKGKRIYGTDASVSTGVTSAIQKIQEGWQIEKFTVHTNNKMTIELKKGTSYDYNSVIDIAPGLNGYANTGTAKTGDKKTPLGNWEIIDIRYIPNQAQFNKSGSNMGAAFWHLSPMTTGERGIGMHGNKRGTLGPTNGCIRLKNADILALQPYIRTGIQISVKQ